MPSPSLTYTLTNGNTADATQVMQNYNDILNGITDGTKDLSISALTCAGTATLNGNINLGNSSADDLSITASLASTLPIKTNNSYDIGSSTLGLRKLFLGNGGAGATCDIVAASHATTREYTIPDCGAPASFIMSIGPRASRYKEINDTLYVILDTDGYDLVYSSTTMTAARTVTLPTLADNLGRMITIKKLDSSVYQILVDGEGTETVDVFADWPLVIQGDSITLIAEASGWAVVAKNATTKWVSYTPTGSWSTNSTWTGYYRRIGQELEIDLKIALAGAPTAATLTTTLPNSWAVDTGAISESTAGDSVYGYGVILDSGLAQYDLVGVYDTTTTMAIRCKSAAFAFVSHSIVNASTPIVFGASDTVSVRFRIPISGWRA